VAALAVLASPAPPAGPTVAATDASPPACGYRDVETELSGYDDWSRTVLDTSYRLPASYAPRDLVAIARAGLPGSGQVRRLVIPDLTDLVRAARASGVPLAAVSGYRSYDSQAGTFAQWIRKKGYRGALAGSARAGHSEHQLGTAIDFTSYPGVKPWYFVWFGSMTARWLGANAWRFGFVASYPAGKGRLTCYNHEPWHYRYVGRSTAAAVRTSGATLREYLWAENTSAGRTAGPRRPAAIRWRTMWAERG
jgi:D-alanyl-D-alanine carboxypeptidase